jgi:ABC-type Fe3+/spermidine/putrescine transport system ATPase subunit
MSKLSAAQLRKRYKARTVVHDVSLDVASGEVVGLLGPNGAGKSTCFYMIVGLIAADGGRIELDGENLSRLPIHRRARRGLSYLPQEASIFRKLTVAENVRAILNAGSRPGHAVQPARRAAGGPVHLAPRGRACHLAVGRRAARCEIPARSRHGHGSYRWTSRSPGWTRSPCSTSRRSSVS